MGLKRINELDYIRGIAMLMVVMGHVLLFSLKIEHTALIALLGICEMPLFFAVSGYLNYKEREENFKRPWLDFCYDQEFYSYLSWCGLC